MNFKKLSLFVAIITCCAANIFASSDLDTSTHQNKKQRTTNPPAVIDLVALELELSQDFNNNCMDAIVKLEKKNEALCKQLKNTNDKLDIARALVCTYGMANGHLEKYNKQLEQENNSLKTLLQTQQTSSSSNQSKH